MRVVRNGAEDAVDFTSMTATWVSETCFEHEWQQQHLKSVSEADCICSRERAAGVALILDKSSRI